MISESDATSEYSLLRERLWAGKVEGEQRSLFGGERVVSEDEFLCLEQCVFYADCDATMLWPMRFGKLSAKSVQCQSQS